MVGFAWFWLFGGYCGWLRLVLFGSCLFLLVVVVFLLVVVCLVFFGSLGLILVDCVFVRTLHVASLRKEHTSKENTFHQRRRKPSEQTTISTKCK